ncbi:MAG: 3-oxoacyl-[acyl-carrier-protein] reductase [Verrucomicrobia bacterium]|nr:3-oxoacyl-[acyl-carrier-protein] reductase [Verrucomicrobiota bacterium]MBV9672337.1 3-oxoacyl-[acyl-carrier-protein] reductase [Verrucomicrobiota bacterium]
MNRYADQVAVITGAGRGIGRAIALRLAAEGARVAVISRTAVNAQIVAEELTKQYSQQALPYSVDVADGDAVANLCSKIVKDFGTISVLVNNAGITRDRLSMRMSGEDWDRVLDTNLKGAFHFVQHLQRHMMRNSYGRIVNISSVSGLLGQAGQVNYSASKAGLIGLTKALAREVSGRNVTVNAVAPGFIQTDMTQNLPESVKADVLKLIPLERFGDCEDVAAAVAFIASPEAKYITGQVIKVDGGMAM